MLLRESEYNSSKSPDEDSATLNDVILYQPSKVVVKPTAEHIWSQVKFIRFLKQKGLYCPDCKNNCPVVSEMYKSLSKIPAHFINNILRDSTNGGRMSAESSSDETAHVEAPIVTGGNRESNEAEAGPGEDIERCPGKCNCILL